MLTSCLHWAVFLNLQADIYFLKVIKVEGDEWGGGDRPDDVDGVV